MHCLGDLVDLVCVTIPLLVLAAFNTIESLQICNGGVDVLRRRRH